VKKKEEQTQRHRVFTRRHWLCDGVGPWTAFGAKGIGRGWDRRGFEGVG
jgi:hypothetical protein